MNTRIVTLLDSLSAMSNLSSLQIWQMDEQAVLRQALEVLIKNVDMEQCSVFLLEGDQLVNRVGVDWSDLLDDGNPTEAPNRKTLQIFNLGEGIIGRAALTRSLEHCQNCATDPRFKPFSISSRHAAKGSLISAPITGGGNLLGVLNVSHPEPEFFDTWHERLLNLYASAMGTLLINCRLMQNMEQLINERTDQLQAALKEASKLKARYEDLSIVDDLTLLHNRRFFFPEAQAAMESAIRYNQPFSIILLDLDHFKRVNDHFGHAVGDRVLTDTAGILFDSIRSCDILARIGGDEFAVALPSTAIEGAMQLAERITGRIKAFSWEHQGEVFHLTASAGITCITDDMGGLEGQALLELLLDQADSGMYRSKEEGRDRICLHAPQPKN